MLSKKLINACMRTYLASFDRNRLVRNMKTQVDVSYIDRPRVFSKRIRLVLKTLNGKAIKKLEVKNDVEDINKICAIVDYISMFTEKADDAYNDETLSLTLIETFLVRLFINFSFAKLLNDEEKVVKILENRICERQPSPFKKYREDTHKAIHDANAELRNKGIDSQFDEESIMRGLSILSNRICDPKFF